MWLGLTPVICHRLDLYNKFVPLKEYNLNEYSNLSIISKKMQMNILQGII